MKRRAIGVYAPPSSSSISRGTPFPRVGRLSSRPFRVFARFEEIITTAFWVHAE